MRYIAVVVALALASPAWAQPGSPTSPPTLPPVRVEDTRVPDERTATPDQAREEIERTPGGVGIVTREQIEETRAANLKDALEWVPGVMIRPRFGAADESQLSIRGSGLRNNFHLRGLNVLIDGFPYGNADGFSDFESLELLATKRIEVFKGANALRFGGNTMGGAVNLVTKTGADASLFESRVEGGSYGFFKGYLGTGQVHGPFDVYVGLSDTELEGYRDHSEQVRRRIYSTFGYRFSGGTTVRFDFGVVRSEENLPGALTRQEFENDPKRADPANVATRAARNYNYTRGAVTVRTPLTEDQTLEWATQLNYQDLDHPLSFAIIDDTTYAWSTELRWILAAPLFGHANRLTVGLQYAGTRQIDVNFNNVLGNRGAKTKDQINEATNIGLYAEEQHDFTPGFTVVLGGRGQYATRAVRDRFTMRDGAGDRDGNDSDAVDFFSVSPKVGFIWRPAKTVQVYGNASHAYEPPLLLELTAPGQVQGNLSQLSAQKSWQLEVGTRGTIGKRVGWDVSLYDIELWDEIQNVNVQPFPFAPFTIPRYRNIERSRHTGVESGADVVLGEDIARRVGLGDVGDSLTARASYTWSRFVFVNDANFGNNDLPGAPRHFVIAELRYQHASGFWFAPGVEVVPHGYFVNSENNARTEAYTLFNVRLGYDYKPWNLGVFLEGRNLTNASYASSVQVDASNRRFFEPGDGRAVYGGVQWRWK
ncbi:MAG TPA: TonB-dependent receptor [Candidatus Nitrosocosmicus sp.]|nr:TonB-dependent receptor [Candidatus Nitrosocosmicus sp.]